MAALTGNTVASSYQGLIKFNDNGTAQPTTLKALSDGTGGSLPISLSQVETKFTSGTVVDFTGVTVNGLPGGAPGLVLGTGSATAEGAPLSMASGSEVTTIAALARGGGDIAIGDNAKTKVAGTTYPSSSIAIGHNADCTAEKAIAIGRDAECTAEKSVGIGWMTSAQDPNSVAIGVNSRSGADSSVAIGNYAGYLGPFAANGAVMIGHDNGFAAGSRSISLGFNSTAKATDGISIGNDARVDSSAYTAAICIGEDTRATAAGAAALGRNVTAAKEDTVSVTELETQLNGGGITMYSPNGTEYKVTVTDAGALLVTSV